MQCRLHCLHHYDTKCWMSSYCKMMACSYLTSVLLVAILVQLAAGSDNSQHQPGSPCETYPPLPQIPHGTLYIDDETATAPLTCDNGYRVTGWAYTCYWDGDNKWVGNAECEIIPNYCPPYPQIENGVLVRRKDSTGPVRSVLDVLVPKCKYEYYPYLDLPYRCIPFNSTQGRWSNSSVPWKYYSPSNKPPQACIAPYFGEQHQGGPSFSPPYQSGVASSYEDAKAQCNAAGARLKAINDRQWDSTESANQFFVTPLPQWYPAYNIQKDTRSGSLENVPRVVSCERTDYRCIAEPGSYYFVARDEYNIPVTASSTVEAEKACYESGGSRVAQIPRACSSGFTAYLREDYGWGQDAIANVTFGFDLSDDPTDWGAKTMVVCERIRYIDSTSHIRLVTAPSVNMKSLSYTGAQASSICKAHGMFLSQMKDSDNIARLNEFRDDIAAKFNVEVWSRYSELGNGKRKGIICQYKPPDAICPIPGLTFFFAYTGTFDGIVKTRNAGTATLLCGTYQSYLADYKEIMKQEALCGLEDNNGLQAGSLRKEVGVAGENSFGYVGDTANPIPVICQRFLKGCSGGLAVAAPPNYRIVMPSTRFNQHTYGQAKEACASAGMVLHNNADPWTRTCTALNRRLYPYADIDVYDLNDPDNAGHLFPKMGILCEALNYRGPAA